jgi:hypothetical protein
MEEEISRLVLCTISRIILVLSEALLCSMGTDISTLQGSPGHFYPRDLADVVAVAQGGLFLLRCGYGNAGVRQLQPWDHRPDFSEQGFALYLPSSGASAWAHQRAPEARRGREGRSNRGPRSSLSSPCWWSLSYCRDLFFDSTQASLDAAYLA